MCNCGTIGCNSCNNNGYSNYNTYNQSTCGSCLQQTNSNCVFYTQSTTPCLHIPTGATLTQILSIIDNAFCNINPSGITNPSGVPTVSGTNNQIIITPTGITPFINYQVGLSSIITGDITTLQTQVANIGTFLNGTITNITTNTPQNLDITNYSKFKYLEYRFFSNS